MRGGNGGVRELPSDRVAKKNKNKNNKNKKGKKRGGGRVHQVEAGTQGYYLLEPLGCDWTMSCQWADMPAGGLA